MMQVSDGIVLEEREIAERFVRAAGPGGQNANKEATAVELRVDLAKSSLPPDVQARAIALGGRHVTTDGVLVIVSRAYRSQRQNHDAARARLAALLTAPPRHPNCARRRSRARPRARRKWSQRSGTARSNVLGARETRISTAAAQHRGVDGDRLSVAVPR
jgi:ribosome-associated protein